MLINLAFSGAIVLLGCAFFEWRVIEAGCLLLDPEPGLVATAPKTPTTRAPLHPRAWKE